MTPNLQQLSLLIIVISSIVSATNFTCDKHNKCAQTLYCDYGEDCNIICAGDSSCNGRIIYCPGIYNSSTPTCNIYCDGSNATHQGCSDMTIWGHNGDLTITAIAGSGSYLMSSTAIYCPWNNQSTCNITCIGNSYGGSDICSDLIVYGNWAESLNVIGYGPSSMPFSNISCPTSANSNQNCFITAYSYHT